ncbi:MAG: WG repeat-containing protein [Clostridia bacterium]|nr:WG repeat-containing protein [Clostridia bacterium]
MKKLLALFSVVLALLALVTYAVAEETSLWPAYDGESGRWGYIREDGVWGIAPQYAQAQRFVNGYAIVKVDGAEGIIDETGRYVIPPEYAIWEGTIGVDGREGNGVFVMERDGRCGWFDTQSGFISGLMWQYVESWDDSPYVLAGINRDLSTFVHRATGERLLPWQDMFSYGFREGVAVVSLGDEETVLVALDGSVTRLPEGIDAPYGEVADGMLLVTDENGLYGYVGLDGQIAIKPQYTEASDFNSGYAVVNDGLLIDREGHVIAEGVLSVCGPWADGGVAVELPGWCWAALNADGTERFRIPVEAYPYAKGVLTRPPLAEGGPWWVGYWYGGVGIDFGLMTAEGEWLVDADDNDACLCLDNEGFSGDPMGWQGTGYGGGYVDAYGNEVFPAQWYYAEHFDGALARVWFDEDWTAAGYINRDGEMVYQWTEVQE